MNPKDQQIAIAKACGWVRNPQYDIKKSADGLYDLNVQIYEKDGHLVSAYQLPRYLTDLNAMHEAEKQLTAEQVPLYLNRLAELTNFEGNEISEEGYTCHTPALFNFIRATATQRAEAFLRTFNLWID